VVTIDELVLADEPARWAALGFTVAAGCLQLGNVRVRLAGPGAGRGILGWSLREIASTELDGLPTTHSDSPPPSPPLPLPPSATIHPNGVKAIDHLVAFSPALDRSVRALQAAGLQLRRIREQPTPAGAPRQAFFRLGEEILEVVQEPDVQEPDTALERHDTALERHRTGADRPARFWGLALLVEDLERTVESMAPHVSEIRPAVQPGRRIATLSRAAGLTIPVALISPPAREGL
jgi:hypothetical protein